LAGLAVAFLGVFLAHRLDTPALDGVASIIIGTILIIVASILAYESRDLIIGESANPALAGDAPATCRRPEPVLSLC
jgi:divalent metal cation (Fe/Co/Zn/Cd) transporter